MWILHSNNVRILMIIRNVDSGAVARVSLDFSGSKILKGGVCRKKDFFAILSRANF